MNNDTNTRGLADFVFLCGIATINVLVCVSQHTIIIIRHQLDLNRRVSATTNSLFKGLPSRPRPFGLQFSLIFAILLLFILDTCLSQWDLHLLIFRSTGSTFSLAKLLHYFLWSRARGGVVVKALRYKLADRGFDSRWCHWNFSVT